MVDVVGRAKMLIESQLDTRSIDAAGSKTGSLLRKALLPAVGALAGLAVGANKAIQAASNLNEQASKSGVIFGAQTKEIRAFADGAAEAFGLSSRAALEATGNFGILAQSAGLTGQEAAGFAEQFTGLAADLASFNNTSTDEAIVAIGAALRGESEPIRKYGVLLDDATLRAKALQLGLIDSVKQGLTPQQRALAASKVILEQTKKAQGDYARTAQSAANQSRTLAAQSENLQAKLGKALLPTYIALQKAVLSFVGLLARHQTMTKAILATVAVLSAVVIAAVAFNAVLAATAGITLAVAGPVLAVVAGLALLAVGFKAAWEHSATFRVIVAGAFTVVTDIIRLALLAFQGLFSALSHVPGFGWAKDVADGIDRIRENLKQLDTKVTDSANNFKKLGDSAEDEVAKLARLFVFTTLPAQIGAEFAKLPKRVQLDFSTNVPQTQQQIVNLAKTIKDVKPAQIKAIIDASGVKTSVAQIQALLVKERKIPIGGDPASLQKTLAEQGIKISKTQSNALLGLDPVSAVETLQQFVAEANTSEPTPELDLDRTTADKIIKDLLGDIDQSKGTVTVTADTTAAREAVNAFLDSDLVKSLKNIIPSGSGVPENATGTRNWPGGLSWVGEQGPELLNLPKGSDVFNNRESKQIAATTQTGDFNLTQVFNGYTSSAEARKNATWAREYGTRFGAANTAVTA